MRDDDIRQARITVDATAEGRRDLDAINEVIQPYVKRVAVSMGCSTEDLDWMVDIAPARY